MVELAVSADLATLGMTAVTVLLNMFLMEVIVQDVLLVPFLIQIKQDVFVTHHKDRKYMLMKSAYVSTFFYCHQLAVS